LYDTCQNNIINNNNILKNNNSGLSLNLLSNNNTFYHNNIIENNQNAYDECSNTWYDSFLQEGNYWSNYDEPVEGAWDNDSNGIADSPLNITGGNNQDLYPFIDKYKSWDVIIDITILGGYSDFVVFGENPGADDEQDNWDVPKPGIPPKPYLYAWFDANLPKPYTKLWKDYRYYPSSIKIWDLYIKYNLTEPSRVFSNIKLSWDTSFINDSGYDHFELYENGNPFPLINMKLKNNYTFNAESDNLYHFQIICRVNPFIIPINKNWNIISTPFYEIIDKNDVIIQNNSINYSWNEAINEGIILDYLYNFNRTIQNYEFSQEFNPGFGYWIWSNYDCDLLISGVQIENNHITDLKENWNIIGYPYNSTIHKTDILVENNSILYSWNETIYEEILIGYIYSWDRINQIYDFSNYLKPGEGYWIYSNFECSLYKTYI
jgi:hypothetical protein